MNSRKHGGVSLDDCTRYGLKIESVLDFSVNINPYGPTPAMREAIANSCIDVYPDASAYEARNALAQFANVQIEQVSIGNGATEIMWDLARVIFQGGGLLAAFVPTFSEFIAAARMQGATIFKHRCSATDNFACNTDALALKLRDHPAKALYLCSPNNPTGYTIPHNSVQDFALAFPDTMIVLDQSFRPLSKQATEREPDWAGNVCRIRSLTKDHSIPGVRLGYIIADSKLISLIHQHRPMWNTNAMAQSAAIASTYSAEQEFVANSRKKLSAELSRVSQRLTQLGFIVLKSSTTFLLVEVEDAFEFREKLLAECVVVRDCTSFGLPNHIRIGIKRPEQNDILLSAFADYQSKRNVSHAS